jgi:uncharacterized membrane protein
MLSVGIVNILNGLINKVAYPFLGFKDKGTAAQISTIRPILSAILLLVSLTAFAESLKSINPYIALILFILPLVFYKAIINYSEQTHQNSRKYTKVNLRRAVVTAFGLVFGFILIFIAFAYLTFDPK